MTAADRAIAQVHGLWTSEDHSSDSDVLLTGLLTGLASTLERATLIAHGDPANGIEPGQVLTDPSVSPLWALPFSAQYTGGTMPARLPGETDNDYLLRARAAVVYPSGMLRGSKTALRVAVQGVIGANKVVRIVPGWGGDPLETLVITSPADTPDLAAVDRAANDNAIVVAGGHVTCVVSGTPLLAEYTRPLSAITATIGTATLADVT